MLHIVRKYSKIVNNGRTLSDISNHMRGEHTELDEEIIHHDNGNSGGQDGIIGESIDVIACALDIIFSHRPEITDEQLNDILLSKCQKWARRYKDSVKGDRSIE